MYLGREKGFMVAEAAKVFDRSDLETSLRVAVPAERGRRYINSIWVSSILGT